METTIISTKYQVVIPKKIREEFQLKPGQKVVFIPFKKSIKIVVVPGVEESFGSLRGINSIVNREEEDRL